MQIGAGTSGAQGRAGLLAALPAALLAGLLAEKAFSKVKALLRKAKARTRMALVEAIGRALELRLPAQRSTLMNTAVSTASTTIPSRHSAMQPTVAGWAYQFITPLYFAREGWSM